MTYGPNFRQFRATAPADRAPITALRTVEENGLISPRSCIQSFFAAPEGKLHLLYGASPVFSAAMALASVAVLRENGVALIDGCNRFNIQAAVAFARARGANPDRMLERMFVSRAFTCYQMEAAVTERLPAFLKSAGARTAVVLGLLDTCYDEEAPFREVRNILLRMSESLNTMRAQGFSVLLAQREWDVRPHERNGLLVSLKEGMDRIYYAPERPNGVPRMVPEQSPSAGMKKGESYGKNGSHIHQYHR